MILGPRFAILVLVAGFLADALASPHPRISEAQAPLDMRVDRNWTTRHG